jgi:methylthioribose-1-phosphate isomerase
MDPTVEWKDGAVRLLDQSRLPLSNDYEYRNASASSAKAGSK